MGRFLILVMIATPLAAAPVPKAVKKPPPQDGLWLAVEEAYEGRLTSDVEWTVWVIDGEDLTLLQNTKTFRQFEAGEKPPCHTYTLRFPDAKDPLAFDLMTGGNEYHAGRMEVTKDTLAVCYSYKPSTKRPTSVAPGDDVIYFSMKRLDRETLKTK